MLATLTMVLFFLPLLFPPVLSQETDQRITDSVDDLLTTCPVNSSLLIREARFDEFTTRLQCGVFCLSRSPDIECRYTSDLLHKCIGRFSLQTLSRVYSGVEAGGDRTAWRKIVGDIDRHGNYKVSYLCVKATGLKPCSKAIREHGTTIAIFPPTVPQAKAQHCGMQCDITLEQSSVRTAPLQWEHQFILRDAPSVEGNNASYQIVFSGRGNQQPWVTFQPSLLTKVVVPSRKTSIQKLRLDFRFQNVSDVLRFWLDFPHTTVNVVCGRDETRTTMTSDSTIITTHSPTQPSAPASSHTITAGTIVYLFVMPVLVFHLLLLVVLIIFLAKRRRDQRLRDEESSLLMTTRRRSTM